MTHAATNEELMACTLRPVEAPHQVLDWNLCHKAGLGCLNSLAFGRSMNDPLEQNSESQCLLINLKNVLFLWGRDAPRTGNAFILFCCTKLCHHDWSQFVTCLWYHHIRCGKDKDCPIGSILYDVQCSRGIHLHDPAFN